MVRAPIKGTMTSPVNGSALVGVELTITKHVAGAAKLGEGAAATIYLTETGSEKVSGNTVLTDSRGAITQGESTKWAPYYVEIGAYDLYWHGPGTNAIYEVQELLSAQEGAISGSLIESSAALKGAPTTTTATTGDSSTKIATTAWVKAQNYGEAGSGGPPSGSAGGSLSGSYPDPGIAAAAVAESQLGAEAVATSKIRALAVTAPKLASSAVETAKIASEAVTGAKLVSSIALPGAPTAVTAAPATSTEQLATTAFVREAVAPTYYETGALSAGVVVGSTQTFAVREGWVVSWATPGIEATWLSGSEGGFVVRLYYKGTVQREQEIPTALGSIGVPFTIAYLAKAAIVSGEWKIEVIAYGASNSVSVADGLMRVGP